LQCIRLRGGVSTQAAGAPIATLLETLNGPGSAPAIANDGQVPLPFFGGLLNDNHLTDVRNSFGNKQAPVAPADIRKVCAADLVRAMLDNSTDLLKAPLPNLVASLPLPTLERQPALETHDSSPRAPFPYWSAASRSG
jgi:hypothetical protein